MSESQSELEGKVIEELARLGMALKIDQYDRWLWLENEVDFSDKNYLVGAWIKRDSITQAVEICGQQCLLKQ